MESTFLQEIYLEGRQEGIQQSIQQVRSAAIEIMTNRFDLNYEAGKALEEKMEDIEDLSLLRRLLVETAMIKSPEEFIAQLQG